MNKGLVSAFELALIGAVVFANGLLIQTPLPDGWSMTLLDKYCQTISDVAFLNRYIKLNPTDSQAYRARAQSYSVDSYWHFVVADCTKALELNNDDAISRRLRAYANYQLEQDDAALSDFNLVINEGKGVALDYAHRALVNFRTKRYDSALADANTAIAKDSLCATGYYARGLVEFKNGKDKDALYDAKLACQLDYEMTGPYILMGMILNDRKKYSRALIMCEQGLLHDPTCGAAHLQSAISQDKLKKYDKAIHSCTVALSVADTKAVRSGAYSTRALAELHKHRAKEAIEDSTKALTIDPECLLAFDVRAKAYSDLNRPAEAGEDKTAAERIRAQLNIPVAEDLTLEEKQPEGLQKSKSDETDTEAIKLEELNPAGGGERQKVNRKVQTQ